MARWETHHKWHLNWNITRKLWTFHQISPAGSCSGGHRPPPSGWAHTDVYSLNYLSCVPMALIMWTETGHQNVWRFIGKAMYTWSMSTFQVRLPEQSSPCFEYWSITWYQRAAHHNKWYTESVGNLHILRLMNIHICRKMIYYMIYKWYVHQPSSTFINLHIIKKCSWLLWPKSHPKKVWWLVSPPLWKMIDFFGWDDDYSQY